MKHGTQAPQKYMFGENDPVAEQGGWTDPNGGAATGTYAPPEWAQPSPFGGGGMRQDPSTLETMYRYFADMY